MLKVSIIASKHYVILPQKKKKSKLFVFCKFLQFFYDVTEIYTWKVKQVYKNCEIR